MKSLNREEFLSKLEQVSPGLATREVVEQSASFVFKDGWIYTYNDEVACRVQYEVGFEAAVHAQPLLELMRRLETKEVGLTLEKGELRVKSGSSRSGIRMEAEIFLPIESVELPEEWMDLDPDFLNAVETVQACASSNDTKFTLTCVHITPDFVEACDDFQLTRYPLDTPVKEECLVRRDALKHIIGLGVDEMGESDAWIHFRSASGLVVSCRKWSEDYPDLAELMVVTGTKTVLPGGLAETIEKAEIFSVDNQEDDHIRVRLKKGQMRLKGEGAHGWYEEQKSVTYDGPAITFLIAPKLLSQIVQQTNECEVSESRLKFDAGKFQYIACLSLAD